MKHLKLALFGPLVMLVSPVSQGQIFTYSKTVIASNPPANGWGMSLEKSIGFFTSTQYPSYFLGSQTGAHIYDLNTGQVITVNPSGYHYERSKPFRYTGEAYDNVAASVDDTLVIYLNPNNTKQAAWTKQIVNPYSGCHDFYALDLDGDGLLDFACSGTSKYDATSFAVFQNTNKTWSASVNIAPSGDGIAPVAVNGLNNGARTNLVGCSPQDSNLYLYKNPGGAAARVPNNWRAQKIGACNEGVSVGTLNVGNRDIVLVASNEGEPVAWPYGMVYYDPGSNPSASPWQQISLGSNFRAVHQVGGAQLGATPLATFGEQEQGSNACNRQGLNDHPDYSGCRVGFFPWTGNGFGPPVIVSNLGTQNQEWLNVGNTLYMAGANHNYYNAVDTAFNLWKIQLSSGSGSPLAAGTYEITSGPQIVDGGFGANNASPYVQFYSINNNAYQYWIWNGSTFLNHGWAGHYMGDGGNGTVTENASGDSWSVTSSGSGFVVKNNRTGNYLENNGGALAMGSTPTVWAFASSTGIPGGSLTGSATTSSAAVNLTTEGTTDWIHWGDTAVNRKSGVRPQLSNYTVVGASPVIGYSNDPRPESWTDGAHTASATNDFNGVFTYTVGNGFSVTAPADTTSRKLILHVGGWNSAGTLTAHLSDGSAVDYTNTATGSTGQYDGNYTLIYNAASAGQTLTVTWTIASGANGHVSVQAAALQ